MSRKLNGTEMKALFILSIVVPVGVLTTFRLTGILQGPITITKTITLEPVEWSFQRPNYTTDIFHTAEGFQKNNGVIVNSRILVVDYVDRPFGNAYFDALYFVSSINSSSSIHDAYIESIHLVLFTDSVQSKVWTDTQESRFENLSLYSITYDKNYSGVDIKFVGINHPNRIFQDASILWMIESPNTQTHLLELSYELTYYNGTAYKKIVQPFQLKLVGIQI